MPLVAPVTDNDVYDAYKIKAAPIVSKSISNLTENKVAAGFCQLMSRDPDSVTLYSPPAEAILLLPCILDSVVDGSVQNAHAIKGKVLARSTQVQTNYPSISVYGTIHLEGEVRNLVDEVAKDINYLEHSLKKLGWLVADEEVSTVTATLGDLYGAYKGSTTHWLKILYAT